MVAVIYYFKIWQRIVLNVNSMYSSGTLCTSNHVTDHTKTPKHVGGQVHWWKSNNLRSLLIKFVSNKAVCHMFFNWLTTITSDETTVRKIFTIRWIGSRAVHFNCVWNHKVILFVLASSATSYLVRYTHKSTCHMVTSIVMYDTNDEFTVS